MSDALDIRTILALIIEPNSDKSTRFTNLQYLVTRVYRMKPYTGKISRSHKITLLKEWKLLVNLYQELGGQWKHIADIQGLLMSHIKPSIRFLLANMTVRDLYPGSNLRAESPLLSHSPDAHTRYDEAKLVILSEAITIVLRCERAEAQKTKGAPGVYQRFMETHTNPQARW